MIEFRCNLVCFEILCVKVVVWGIFFLQSFLADLFTEISVVSKCRFKFSAALALSSRFMRNFELREEDLCVFHNVVVFFGFILCFEIPMESIGSHSRNLGLIFARRISC